MINIKSLIFLILILVLSSYYLYSDAYLANEDIHYGADSYKIDYEKEIITATGNAYFKKEDKILLANKIVIFYSKKISKAECFGNVILKDKGNNSLIKGNYGVVKYTEKVYFLSGNVNYRDKNTNIFSDKVYYFSQKGIYLFEGNVDYQNNTYRIIADELKIDNNKAVFNKRVKLVNNKKGEVLYSMLMEYNLKNNDSFFKGKVIYLINQPSNNFLISADVIKYSSKLNSYFLINDVFIITKKYRINADYMVYNNDRDYLRAVGNVIASGKNYKMRGDSYIINNISREIDFFGNLSGIFNVKSH